MTFEELLDQVLEMLQRRGRVSYRAVQRQFDVNDATLEDVKAELLYAHSNLVTDEDRGLVWTGAAGPTHMPTASPLSRGSLCGAVLSPRNPIPLTPTSSG